MGTPQQPELRRSGHTPVVQDHAAEKAPASPKAPAGRRRTGSVPPENQPGHHPETEQDKPTGPPPTGQSGGDADEGADAGPGPDREMASGAGSHVRRFPFEFSSRLAPLAAAFGVTPSRAYVDVGAEQLLIRFGFWSLRTPLANVRDLQTTGPYRWWKVAGPAHISVADGGVTFATTTAGGLCIQFHEPVPAALPLSALRHPSATVTVATPQALIDTINERRPH